MLYETWKSITPLKDVQHLYFLSFFFFDNMNALVYNCYLLNDLYLDLCEALVKKKNTLLKGFYFNIEESNQFGEINVRCPI